MYYKLVLCMCKKATLKARYKVHEQTHLTSCKVFILYENSTVTYKLYFISSFQYINLTAFLK